MRKATHGNIMVGLNFPGFVLCFMIVIDAGWFWKFVNKCIILVVGKTSEIEYI